MVTLDELVGFAVILMACWGFYKIIMEIVEAVTKRHDKEQKWGEWEENLQNGLGIYIWYDDKVSFNKYFRDKY